MLFDEIEKAHPDVMNLLLQILEEGKITDSLGRKIDFRNTIIIMTSNVGAELIKRQTTMGFGALERDEADYEVMREKILEEAKRVFKPEFLNRLDDLIVFHTLDEGRPAQDRRSRSRQGHQAPQGQEHPPRRSTRRRRSLLIEKGYDPTYGARPMRRAVERYLEDPLAEEILRGNMKDGDTVHVSAEKTKLTFQMPEHAEPAGASQDAS